eukprot:gene27103-32647_t
MAAVCDVCAKGPGFGKSVSHSHRRTNRRWNPNIQSVRTEVAPGNTRRQGRSGLIARAQTIAGSAPVTSVTGAELYLCGLTSIDDLSKVTLDEGVLRITISTAANGTSLDDEGLVQGAQALET